MNTYLATIARARSRKLTVTWWSSHVQPIIHTRLFTLLMVLLCGGVGFWLAPADLPTGSYTATLSTTLAGEHFSIDYPFTLGQPGEPQTISRSAGPYRLVVSGPAGFATQLNQRITYRFKVLDAQGEPVHIPLDQATSVITDKTGAGYGQSVPPTEREGDWLLFQMRLPYKAPLAMGLLFMVAALWLTELVPLAAAALLIPVVAVIAGITDAATILQPFAHPIIMLFLAGFLMAEGMHRTGVDRRIALTILSHTSLKPAYLMLTMMGLTAFLSMWMSNTASIAIIIPIALAVLNGLEAEAGQTGFRRALILGVAYAATIGGVGSAIGTPANILALTFLNDFAGTELAFVDWFAYGLPMVLVMIPILWLYLTLTFRVKFGRISNALDGQVYDAALAELGPPDRRQRLVLGVFIGVMALWLTERWHGLPTVIVALSGVLLLFLFEVIQQSDLNQINWNALLTFGGGLAIGTLLVSTGVSDWIALRLTALGSLPPLLVIFIVAGLTLITGAFISNTACAAMLIPLAIPLAQILQLDPRLLVAVVAIGSSIDFALVVGTPPTMMAYSTGYFKASEIFRRGIILDLIGLLLLAFGVIWIWRLLGVVTF